MSSNASQTIESKPATVTEPKRKVTRVKKQTPVPASVSASVPAARVVPTLVVPTPVSISIPIESENITISHSIRIVKDPVTNSYTYSYIGPNGDELLNSSIHNNGADSDSGNDSSSICSNNSHSDSDSDDDNESQQNKYLLSTAKEISEKLSTMIIDTEGCEPLYKSREITYDILLPFILINMHASSRSNILALLHTTLVNCIEGRCISDGFIKPESVRILDFKCGKLIGKNVQFNLVIECLICNPVEQTVICCFAKNITQAGIRALSADVHLPVVVYIARDYNVNNPNTYYNSIKEGDAIKVRIIGKRFEINDKNIQIIGDLVLPKKECLPHPHPHQQKSKQPPIVIGGTATITTATAPATPATPVIVAAVSKAPKTPKEPKAPKTPKEPKAPKTPKEPKASKKNADVSNAD